MNDPYALSYHDSDPETQIRTDLWSTMSNQQLVVQRDLLMDRMAAVQRMVSISATPAVLGIYDAMQLGLNDINQLIERKSNIKTKR